MAMPIEFTGQVSSQVKALDSIEYGPLGASVELHLQIQPEANDAFRGLWSSEGHVADEVITMRTVCRPDHIALGLDDGEGSLDRDLASVIAHLARVNSAYTALAERGAQAARRAASRLGAADV